MPIEIVITGSSSAKRVFALDDPVTHLSSKGFSYED